MKYNLNKNVRELHKSNIVKKYYINKMLLYY